MGKLRKNLVKLIDYLHNKVHPEDEVPSLEEQLSYIMKCFDFERVQVFMNWERSHRIYDDDGVCIDEKPWKMILEEGVYDVPTVEDLRELAKSQLEQVCKLYEPNNPDRQLIWIGSGPFKSVCRYGILELMCVIEYWSYD